MAARGTRGVEQERKAKEATKVRWQKPKSRISTKRRIKFLNLVPSLFLDQKQKATGTRRATSNEMGTGGGAGRGRVGGGRQKQMEKKKTTAIMRGAQRYTEKKVLHNIVD